MEAQKQIFQVIESELDGVKETEGDALEKTLQEVEDRVSFTNDFFPPLSLLISTPEVP